MKTKQTKTQTNQPTLPVRFLTCMKAVKQCDVRIYGKDQSEVRWKKMTTE